MQKSKKIITWLLIIVGIVFVILFISASVYINRFKPHLEEMLTRNFGMQTTIDGAISLKAMPGLSFSAHKVKVVNNETYVLRIEKIEIYVDYAKLFNGKVEVKELHFKKPQLYVIRNLDGTYNFETAMALLLPQSADEIAKSEINLTELTIKKGNILYIDRLFEDTLNLQGINLESEDIGLVGNLDNFDPMKIRFKGTLGINEFTLNNLKIDSMFFEVNGDKGKLSIVEKSKPFWGGEVTGTILFDFNQEPVLVHNQHKVSQLDMDEFFRSIGSKVYLSGFADYEFDLSFQSFGWGKAVQSMSGSFHMYGSNMEVHGIDLHGYINRLTTAQTFSSIDLMAIFLAGPYGAAFSRGMDFDRLLSGDNNDMTPVQEMRSNWKIQEGKAISEDVAINTGKYRIAVNGTLDFTSDQYQDLELSIINREGCAAFSQRLNGPFMAPETEGMLNLGLFRGEIDNLEAMLSRPAQGGCEPVYTGSVKHP